MDVLLPKIARNNICSQHSNKTRPLVPSVVLQAETKSAEKLWTVFAVKQSKTPVQTFFNVEQTSFRLTECSTTTYAVRTLQAEHRSRERRERGTCNCS